MKKNKQANKENKKKCKKKVSYSEVMQLDKKSRLVKRHDELMETIDKLGYSKDIAETIKIVNNIIKFEIVKELIDTGKFKDADVAEFASMTILFHKGIVVA